MTLMEDKFIGNSSLAFYKQNLYEYEQDTAAGVVKGRLRVHLPFWVEIGAPPWVLETIRSGYVIPLPVFACLVTYRLSIRWVDRPPVLQVVEFSDPSSVFAPVRDGHNTTFCPFRFKSAVLALSLDGSALVP